MIARILLVISLIFNVALYFGWMDLGQYRDTVDNAVETGQDIAKDPATQKFLENVKQTVQENFSGDIEKLKTRLKDKSEEQVRTYLEKKYSGQDQKMIDKTVQYIKSDTGNVSTGSSQ